MGNLRGGGSAKPPLPRNERERYRPQHGDQQMPIAERPVDDRDHSKQGEDRVAEVPAVHSRFTGVLAILPLAPRLKESAPGRKEKRSATQRTFAQF